MNVSGDSCNWEADGSAVNIELGEIPDRAILFVNTEATNPDIYFWFRNFVDSDSMHGLLLTGSTGEVTRVTTAATGMIAYDSGVIIGVNVKSPVPGAADVFSTVADWSSAVSTAATARSATAVGTIIRPTTHNGRVYECTTAGTSTGTEPTSYTTVVGETVTDNDVVFTCIDENVAQKSAAGLTVGETTQTNSGENYLWVERSANHRDRGDAARNATFI